MHDRYDDDILRVLVATLVKADDHRYDLERLISKALSMAVDRAGGLDSFAGWTSMRGRALLDELVERGDNTSIEQLRLGRVVAYVKASPVPVTAASIGRESGISTDVLAADLAHLATTEEVTLFYPEPPTYV